jgi:hypothetical protein
VITDLLNQRTKYHGLSWRPSLNKEIIEGRFDIDEIRRIGMLYGELDELKKATTLII